MKGHLTGNCRTAVLIPKGNGYFHGISLVEVLWKMVTGILNFFLVGNIQFHDTLHSFRTGRGAGNAYLEAKLLQKLMDMMEEVLYEIFSYLHKSYGALY